jgi:hypothetical protein
MYDIVCPIDKSLQIPIINLCKRNIQAKLQPF